MQITQHTLSLYFHAYQAWLFNLIASRRIGELGMEPIVGDLVLPPSAINGVDLTDGSADSTTAIDPDDDTGSGMWLKCFERYGIRYRHGCEYH